jgi:hypothetical protein
MALSMPKHSEWKKFKETYGVPAGAVSGVNVGKELDKYWDGMEQGKFMKNAALAEALEKKLAEYLKKLDKKKVTKKTYDGFKTEFTKDYVLVANQLAEEYRAMGGELKTFTDRVDLMFKEGRKLKPGATLTELQQYRQGPVRGCLAAATKVKGFDPKDINQLWKFIDDTINNLGTTDTQETLDKVVKLILLTIPTTETKCKAAGLAL